MDNDRNNILVWLPSPMGDAVLSTPALRAIRRRFQSSHITFLAERIVREVLSPSAFTDSWLELPKGRPLTIARILRPGRFTHALLFKNSFASALAVFLAGIPSRIGYAREGRSIFLTERLHPPRLPRGRFKPASMIDYYLAIASSLGCDTTVRTLQLRIDPDSREKLLSRLPDIVKHDAPLVVMVPGGAFGPSKYWPAPNFAETADRLISTYNAAVVVSAAANPAEQRIAGEICRLSRHQLINLAETPVSLGELKALFSHADLVISNDTGPRHIAIALGRKVITLFGPNDPVWTDSGYDREIQLIGRAPCAPCARPKCRKAEHLCMQAITVEMVCDAADKLLNESQDNPV
ncbi:MAG TPA: lipopolysaccharide heptosyltransferase II [Sedimentisphaerales bacterium]|nr:lipopolysaccharide heptosyltransferase II [Sedimentisphaerales bacterium]